MKAGFLFQLGGLWVGAHYSRTERRWCINLLPCCTIWIALKGGRPPYRVTKVQDAALPVPVANR
jgi:hypothetical protein